MDKKLLNEIERIKSLISEETLYGNQIDNPPLLTEDWRFMIKKLLLSNKKSIDEIPEILNDFNNIIKKSTNSIGTKIENMDNKSFTNYVKGDEFINDLEKSKEIYGDNDFIKKLDELGIKNDELIGNLQVQHNEVVGKLKELIEKGKTVSSTSSETIFKPLNLDDAFIKKYNEVFNVKKTGIISKNEEILKKKIPFLSKTYKELKEIKSAPKSLGGVLNYLFNPFRMKPIQNWAKNFYGGGMKSSDVNFKDIIKNPSKDSFMGQLKKIPKAGIKGNFKKGSPLWNAAVKWAKLGPWTLGGTYYRTYVSWAIMRYLAETGWCDYVASSSQKRDYVKDHYEPLIDNKIDVLLKEQREKDRIDVVETVKTLWFIFSWFTGFPFLSKKGIIDPLGYFEITKDFSPFSGEFCSNKEKYNEINEVEEKLINYLIDNDISIESEDGRVITGDEIKNNLDLALKEFRDAADAAKKSITSLNYKPLVKELKEIKLIDEYGNTITYEGNKDKFMQIINNYIAKGKIPIDKIIKNNEQ